MIGQTSPEGTQLGENYRSKKKVWPKGTNKIIMEMCVFICVLLLLEGRGRWLYHGADIRHRNQRG